MKRLLVLALTLALAATLLTVPAASAQEEPYKFSLFANLVTEMQDSDVKFFEELQSRTNTIIDVQIPPSSSYTESITIMLASMDYPDVVLFPDHTMNAYVDAVKNGVVLPVNPYLESAPNLTQYTYDVSWKTLKILGDDNIYGIPRTSIARADGFLIRKDWLDNLGIEFDEYKPITLAKFREILDAFVNNDPDGNGVADTYGLTKESSEGVLYVPSPISWAYGLIGWQQYDNEEFEYMDLSKSRVSDNFKSALEYTRDLYANKLIDPDWPTLSTDAKNLRFQQGIVGVKDEFAGWMPDFQSKAQSVNPDAQLAYIVGLTEEEGGTVRGGSFSTGFWGQFAIMNSAKDPQKIVDVFDYMLSDEFWPDVMYGLEGVAWNYDGEGNRVAIPNANYAAGRAILRRNNAPDFFVGLNIAVDDRQRVSDLIGVCIEQAVFSLDEGFKPAIANEPSYIDANKAYDVAVSQIIAGDRPIDDYDKILEAWYAGGGEIYIQQMNEGIKAGK
jgi:putative aldouronate transport system substrate-binding protein